MLVEVDGDHWKSSTSFATRDRRSSRVTVGISYTCACTVCDNGEEKGELRFFVQFLRRFSLVAYPTLSLILKGIFTCLNEIASESSKVFAIR